MSFNLYLFLQYRNSSTETIESIIQKNQNMFFRRALLYYFDHKFTISGTRDGSTVPIQRQSITLYKLQVYYNICIQFESL